MCPSRAFQKSFYPAWAVLGTGSLVRLSLATPTSVLESCHLSRLHPGHETQVHSPPQPMQLIWVTVTQCPPRACWGGGAGSEDGESPSQTTTFELSWLFSHSPKPHLLHIEKHCFLFLVVGSFALSQEIFSQTCCLCPSPFHSPALPRFFKTQNLGMSFPRLHLPLCSQEFLQRNSKCCFN